MEEMTKERKIELAEKKGWNYWANYGRERLYLNFKKVKGLDFDLYKSSGLVSNFSYKGESYPHVYGNTILNSKVYIDLKTNELVKPELREDIQELLNRIIDEHII